MIFSSASFFVFFAAVIPPFLWDKLFPARFSVTFDHEHHQALCRFSDPAYAAEFAALNYPSLHGGLEPPKNLQLGDQPIPQPFELPASFNPTSSKSNPSSSSFNVAESHEDKSNPFRNLEDPRFRK